jgi:hypothetical protein
MLKSLRNLMLTAAAIAVWNFGAAVQVQAASDCPRGTLDERYCDANGDLRRTCRPMRVNGSIPTR